MRFFLRDHFPLTNFAQQNFAIGGQNSITESSDVSCQSISGGGSDFRHGGILEFTQNKKTSQ